MADTPEKPRRALAPELSGGALDTLWCLFLNGPTWDGNIPSKAGRSELLQHGYAERRSAHAFLTAAGVELALGLDMEERKERHDMERRKRSMAADALVKAAQQARETAALSSQLPHADPACFDEVTALGVRLGFGNLMATASVAWRQWLADNDWPTGGEFVSSPCRRIAELDAEALGDALKLWSDAHG